MVYSLLVPILCLLSHIFSVPSSRSIVQINVSLSFQPHSINVIQKTCQRAGRESACLNATACFTTVSRSPGPHSSSFGITLYAFIDLKFIGLPSYQIKCCEQVFSQFAFIFYSFVLLFQSFSELF